MKLQTAKGVKDLAPEEKIIKNLVVDTLKEVFGLYGYFPLETPIIERYDTLAAKFAAGEESDALKEIFRLTDQGKRKLGLRFDLTVPLARYVAMNPQLKMPFKRYEIGPVFRDGPIKTGRLRQFWQGDADIIGIWSVIAEAELLAMAQEIFNRLKLDVVIKVNNRKILTSILEQVGIAKEEEAIISIDKLEKIGKAGVTKELLAKGCKKIQVKKLFELIKEGITLSQLEKKIKNQEGIQEMKDLLEYLRKMKVNKAVFDISLARGLAYYTGTVFEIFLKKGKITSSLAAGGRYDQLIGRFMEVKTSPGLPAVGISFGLAPIMETLKEKKGLRGEKTNRIFLIPIKTEKDSLKITQQLREEGFETEFDLTGRGISKSLQYANSKNFPYVIIVGEKELKQNKVLLRNMETGAQQLLAIKDVIKKLK